MGITIAMNTLHVFGCSITQGFALPDVVRPITDQEEAALGRPFHPMDCHIYAPSQYAWPQVLGDRIGFAVHNYARRGACFQQIARQCAVEVKNIRPTDTVMVMWTYLSRLSLQWPARTSVPFCNIVDSNWGWQTRILPGFNRFFGLSAAPTDTQRTDARIHKYIEDSAKITYLDPLGVYNQYYNNMILQVMTAGFLANTGARVIHLSVETEPSLDQLELARQNLDASLREPYVIPDPKTWYDLSVDHDSCFVIHDPSIPPAENDMHPSITHHRNFADRVYARYFA